MTFGDELVCSGGKHGTKVSDLKTMIDTVRKSFPDRNEAILHYNECGGTFGDFGSCKNAIMKDVPSGLDWISIDRYRKSSKDSGFITKKIKGYYKDCLYPKMHSNQKVCIVPGTSDGVCPDQKTCLQDAKDTVKWAESDSKVACNTPYRWDDLEKDDWSELKDYWKNYGKKALSENTTLV